MRHHKLTAKELNELQPNATVSNRYLREARQFASKARKEVRNPRTYYTVETFEFPAPFGPTHILGEWRFTHLQHITAAPMCGAVSAERAWNNFGRLFSDRPYKNKPGDIKTLDEFMASITIGDYKRGDDYTLPELAGIESWQAIKGRDLKGIRVAFEALVRARKEMATV